MSDLVNGLSAIELCAGGGGQALGLEQAGYGHLALVEIDHHSCSTLQLNRPSWNVIEGSICDFQAKDYKKPDLLAAGLPCPPFSVAGKQLGHADERNLFPDAIRLIDEFRPTAVMIENVRGILEAIFEDYREYIEGQVRKLGYQCDWCLLNASDFGVPQLRPRVVFVAVRKQIAEFFSWPVPNKTNSKTVGGVLYPLMASRGWKGAKAWREKANAIAPTIVGGSTKHGGPDLGPTRAKQLWAKLGVDALTIADEPPGRDFVGIPRLTVPMVARLQGFPGDWTFSGRKTPAYRQVGNAFPPPVARAVGEAIAKCIKSKRLIALGSYKSA